MVRQLKITTNKKWSKIYKAYLLGTFFAFMSLIAEQFLAALFHEVC